MPRIDRAPLALLALCAACLLGACIGPGLEPPDGQRASTPNAPPPPAASDAGMQMGSPGLGNTGASGTGQGATGGDTSTDTESEPPRSPDSGASGPEPIDDEDAGTDPTTSP